MPKHVASSARGRLGWNAVRLTGDVPPALADLVRFDSGVTLQVYRPAS